MVEWMSCKAATAIRLNGNLKTIRDFELEGLLA